MRDPFSWSLPLFRVFGITVRMHFLFLMFVVVTWLRVATDKEAPAGSGAAVLVLQAMLFLSVLLHEFGHCFAARWVDGDAQEILIWPLGGLAYCDVPHSAKANFICTAGGPLVNLVLCVVSGLAIWAVGFYPSFDPRPSQCWVPNLVHISDGIKYWSYLYVSPDTPKLDYWIFLAGQFFWVNWGLLLLNILILGFPLDGGRMLQAALWPRLGYRQSMLTAIFIGFLFMFIIGVFSLVEKDPLYLCLAGFIYFSCKQQMILLETGGEESLFGYDFSQGYTSLERDNPPPPRRKRQNFIQRWLAKRAARKVQREQERAEAEELRMDELLEKIQRQGKQALTDEENRFLKRVADKYRNRP